MKKSQLVLIALAVASIVFFFWTWSRSNSQPPQTLAKSDSVTSAASTVPAFESKTSSDGWAEIEILPLALTPREWSFKVNLNAHQEMDVDLMKVATLTDEKGDTLAPLRWEEPNPGGHHRQGTLVFKAPPSLPESITITITNVGGAATRTFSWDLQ